MAQETIPALDSNRRKEIQNIIINHQWKDLAFHDLHVKIPDDCKLHSQFTELSNFNIEKFEQNFEQAYQRPISIHIPRNANNGIVVIRINNYIFEIYKNSISVVVALTDTPKNAIYIKAYEDTFNQIRELVTDLNVSNMSINRHGQAYKKGDRYMNVPRSKDFLITYLHLNRDSRPPSAYVGKPITGYLTDNILYEIYNHKNKETKVISCRYELKISPKPAATLQNIVQYVNSYDPINL